MTSVEVACDDGRVWAFFGSPSPTKPYFFEHEIWLKQSRANGPLHQTDHASSFLFRGALKVHNARMSNYNSAPICLLCQEPMQVVRTIPTVARLPEVLVFYCKGCGEVETRERDRAA
jgi:hypothetical protein